VIISHRFIAHQIATPQKCSHSETYRHPSTDEKWSTAWYLSSGRYS